MSEENEEKKPSVSPKELFESLKKVSRGKDELPQLKHTEDSEDLEQMDLDLCSASAIEEDPNIRAQAVSQMEDFLKIADGMLEVEQKKKDSSKQADPNAPTNVIWTDLAIFFRQLAAVYNLRYEMWEGFYTNVMNILGKIYKVNKENSENLIVAIENVSEKLNEDLNKFIKKRDEVERYSDVDFKNVQKNLRKSLNLLSLQLKAFKLNEKVNEIYNIYVP